MPRSAPRHDRDAGGPAEVLAAWQAAGTVKANPDSAQWPVRQRALEDGKTVYMAVPRLAELEPFFALASAAGLIGPHTVCVTTVHEIQLYPAGTIPLTGHDIPVDFIITPDRVIACRPGHGPRTAAGICWDDLTEEKIAAIPLLTALRSGS